jgi:GT2 family glycosyltransferase
MRHVVFEPTEAAVASVIVLAWRLADELLDCLDSLARGKRDDPFEVVVVLNGAAESVRDAVASVEGATIVEAPVNLGFAGGCNLGASRARGEFLAFLNDDAVPEPEWLDSLIGSVRARPGAGAITSRVLNPDGALQEAGARILASGDGIAMVEGKLDEPRPVDFGGGEALLVRRDAFVELGGFDQAYDPAYFEDADLCLRLRSAGWDVVYEPSAVVIHHKARSTNEASEWRTFAYERSRAIFVGHWGSLLPEAAAADDPPSALLPVPPGRGARQLDLSRQVEEAAVDYGALETRRLREFGDWLTDRLRRATASVEELRAEAAELHAHTAAQQSELDSLRAAPLHALLRWRYGGGAKRL